MDFELSCHKKINFEKKYKFTVRVVLQHKVEDHILKLK